MFFFFSLDTKEQGYYSNKATAASMLIPSVNTSPKDSDGSIRSWS